MKIEDGKVEPVTDLGLSLDYCSRYDQTISNDDQGAGANAGSSVHMAFVSANPLTELVWCPQGGLSLKCADCSFTERKPSLPWGEGTGTTHDSFPEMDVAAPSCSIVPLDELNSTSSKERVNAKSATIGENTTRKFSICDTCFIPAPGSSKEERDGNGDGPDDMVDQKPPTEVYLINKSIETEEGESLKQQKYSITSKDEENTSKDEENSLPDSPDQVWSNSINSHISILFCGDPSMEEEEVDPTNRVIGMEIEPTSEAETLNEHEDSDSPASSRGKEKNKKRSDSDISSPPRLDKLETTTENDLLMFNKERTFDLPANVVAPESGPAVKTSSLEEREVKESVGAKESNDDGRFLEHHSKGKGKALSNGDLSGLPSKDDNDSYESVESCNSAGRFSSGKRRWSFQQQLIVGSKRAKHSEDMHGSSSVVKNDSSFMKWISSMIKGVAKSNRDDEGLLALSLSNPDESCKESMNHSLPMDRKTQTLNGRNSGFNSIFRSIYCPNNTAQEASTALCSNLIRVTPMEIDTIGKRENSAELQAPKENLHESESRNIVGPLTLPQVSFGNFAVSLENRLPGPTENKNSGMLEGGHAKVTVQSLNASRIMLKTNPENEIPLAEEKKTNEDSHKGGEAIESSWISRFSSKASVSLLKLDSPDFHRNQVSVEVKKSSSQESPNVADNEQKGYAVDNEASTGFRQIENLHDKFLSNSMHKILPSQRVENSEAIASIFARRLDALKNIIPSHLIDGTSIDDTTCFFCGIKGHHLLNCSEISKSELEDLLKNVKSYDNAGASPRLCIRCFQLNHWASACPNTLHKEKAKASLPENVTRDRLNCSITFEEVSIGHNLIANLDVKRYNSLSHGGNHSGEHLKKSSEKDLRLQITDVPEGIFAAVKLLQLSRVDILKWMNSKISLSQLDGLFLRLRLGKWEEGLGGTGYYVACITGMQKEKTLKNAKSPISVSIGGINYLVETKYISNQDFLEDELMTWWCTTSRERGKVLSEEDFKRKAEEKKRLGF